MGLAAMSFPLPIADVTPVTNNGIPETKTSFRYKITTSVSNICSLLHHILNFMIP